ncbi:unnamed protein product, partial [Scytosiphon promiscuus]
YPVSSLIHYIPRDTPIYFIDPRPNISKTDFNGLTIIQASAVNGVPQLVSDLIGRVS